MKLDEVTTLLHHPAPTRVHTLAAHRLRALLVEAGFSVVGTSGKPQRSPRWTFAPLFAVKPHPDH